MSRTSLRHAFVLVAAVLLVPAVAAAQPGDAAAGEAGAAATTAPEAWQHETGLMLELRVVASPPNRIPLDVPEPRGGLFAGYQHRRFAVGLGFELARQTSNPDPNSTFDDTSITTNLFLVGGRVTVGRSKDRRAELLVLGDLGFGESRYSSSSTGATDDVWSRFRVDVGPEVRYWLAESFAIGASGVVRHESVTHENTFGSPSEELTRTDLVTSLVLVGVF